MTNAAELHKWIRRIRNERRRSYAEALLAAGMRHEPKPLRPKGIPGVRELERRILEVRGVRYAAPKPKIVPLDQTFKY